MSETIGRREQKKLLVRSKIVEAAVEQFSKNGFQATSIADIMRTADMGLGTFYNYFASKDEILHYLLDGLAVDIKERLQSLQEQNVNCAEMLRMMVETMANLVGQNKFILPLFLSASEKFARQESGEPEKKKPHGPAFMAMFLQLIRSGQANGEFRQDISAEIITEMLHSLFQAAAFSSLPLSFEENVNMKLRLIIDGISVQKQE